MGSTRLLIAFAVLGACHHDADYKLPPSVVHDAAVSCGLVTCESLGATCGPIGDGCGNVFQCGSCTAPQICGGAGTLFTCGESPCVPRTCAEANVACGRVSDGCGGLTPDCGACTVTGESCGGAGTANQCGSPPCTGLCLQQNACGTTTITGDDTATWGTPDPIFGATVYVPNGAVGPPTYGVTAFAPGVSCDSCSTLVSGSPLVIATTAVDGTFSVENAPCGTDIPLVIQLGRWRRQITIPSVACCATTTLTAAKTHLPRTHAGEPGDLRSDIPLLAVSTGAADPLHCMLRKIGIDDSEFTNPNQSGRVHLYLDNGAAIDGSTPPASTLYGNASELAKYDTALFECVGDQDPKAAADQQRVINFANAGGRVFTTHYSYVWLTDSDGDASTNTGPLPFSETASWLVNQSGADEVTAFVDQTLQGDLETQARRIAFASWLQLTGASTIAGQISITAARNDFNGVNSAPATEADTPAQRWLFTATPFAAPLHYTFDTPIAYAPNPLPTKRCGRVLYSDFHVVDTITGGAIFPTDCVAAPMTPQEKTLEFMLFDLTSCIGPQVEACKPLTCEQQGFVCGSAGDGCDDGVILNCGGCMDGEFCGGSDDGGCGYGSCVPRTCADVHANCGPIGNGCGGTVDCGTCPESAVCGGNGQANVCSITI
jgi:hypothetical protein